MSALEWIVLSLAAFRLADMLTRDAGPAKLFIRIRGWSAAWGPLHCFGCTSVWTAAAVLVLWATPYTSWIVYMLALSAAAVLLFWWFKVGEKNGA